jgi:hypothetical protein
VISVRSSALVVHVEQAPLGLHSAKFMRLRACATEARLFKWAPRWRRHHSRGRLCHTNQAAAKATYRNVRDLAAAAGGTSDD